MKQTRINIWNSALKAILILQSRFWHKECSKFLRQISVAEILFSFFWFPNLMISDFLGKESQKNARSF